MVKIQEGVVVTEKRGYLCWGLLLTSAIGFLWLAYKVARIQGAHEALKQKILRLESRIRELEMTQHTYMSQTRYEIDLIYKEIQELKRTVLTQTALSTSRR